MAQAQPAAMDVEPADLTPSLQPGREAIIHSLVSRADLNGRVCTLKQFDEQAQRWAVHFDGEAGGLKVKPTNLEPTPRAELSELRRRIADARRAHDANPLDVDAYGALAALMAELPPPIEELVRPEAFEAPAERKREAYALSLGVPDDFFFTDLNGGHDPLIFLGKRLPNCRAISLVDRVNAAVTLFGSNRELDKSELEELKRAARRLEKTGALLGAGSALLRCARVYLDLAGVAVGAYPIRNAQLISQGLAAPRGDSGERMARVLEGHALECIQTAVEYAQRRPAGHVGARELERRAARLAAPIDRTGTACFNMGVHAREKGHYESALELFELGAERRLPDALAEVGMVRFYGQLGTHSVPREHARALVLFDLAHAMSSAAEAAAARAPAGADDDEMVPPLHPYRAHQIHECRVLAELCAAEAAAPPDAERDALAVLRDGVVPVFFDILKRPPGAPHPLPVYSGPRAW